MDMRLCASILGQLTLESRLQRSRSVGRESRPNAHRHQADIGLGACGAGDLQLCTRHGAQTLHVPVGAPSMTASFRPESAHLPLNGPAAAGFIAHCDH